MCEFVCPSKAIKVTPSAIPEDSQYAFIEKGPADFQIDMSRFIYCGLCLEDCPEQSIFMGSEFSVNAYTRAGLVRHKDDLYKIGGVVPDKIMKWQKIKEREAK